VLRFWGACAGASNPANDHGENANQRQSRSPLRDSDIEIPCFMRRSSSPRVIRMAVSGRHRTLCFLFLRGQARTRDGHSCRFPAFPALGSPIFRRWHYCRESCNSTSPPIWVGKERRQGERQVRGRRQAPPSVGRISAA
jgi:hypothetical protein